MKIRTIWILLVVLVLVSSFVAAGFLDRFFSGNGITGAQTVQQGGNVNTETFTRQDINEGPKTVWCGGRKATSNKASLLDTTCIIGNGDTQGKNFYLTVGEAKVGNNPPPKLIIAQMLSPGPGGGQRSDRLAIKSPRDLLPVIVELKGDLLVSNSLKIQSMGQAQTSKGVSTSSDTGNAFVCVDNSGKLLRSLTPCR